MDFNGKVGLVTGAASGIGRATALGFAQRGGAVAVADINEENANAVVAEITAAGGRATAVIADVTQQADLDRMIATTTAAFGRLDFLHNNAFGLPAARPDSTVMARTADLEDRVWDNTIDLGCRPSFTP